MPKNPVTVQVLLQDAIPSEAALDTILLAAYHTATVGPRVATVASITDAESQGFTTTATPAVHRAITVALSQRPRPTRIKIGRRATAPTQSLNLTPLAAQGTGFVWTVTIDGTAVTYVEAGSDTVALIIDGLVAAITTAALGMDATDNVTDFDLDADTAGEIHSVKVDLSVFDLVDDTTDPGLAADLSAFENEDSDFFLVALDSNSEAEVLAAAAWAETRDKLLAYDAYESGVLDSLDSGDVASQLNTLQRRRTFGAWTDGRISNYYALGWAAFVLATRDPGRTTWAYKRTFGVEQYRELNSSQIGTLEGKEVNWFGVFAGPDYVWQRGRTAEGEWIDVERLITFVKIRQRELVAQVLLANAKVPYTAAGFQLLNGPLSQFLVSLTEGDNPAASDDPAPFVSIPAPNDVSAADRTERLLPGVETSFVLAGAVHEVTVTTILQVSP